MQKIILNNQTIFKVESIIAYGDQLEINFAEGTLLEDVIKTYDEYNNKEFSKEALRHFNIYKINTEIDPETNEEIEHEEHQGLHIGYTIPKGITMFNGKIKVLLEKEPEIDIQIEELEKKIIEQEKIIADLMLKIAMQNK